MVITHNMKNKKLLLGIAWAWLTCMSANAEVKLPAFFSDGMVMQQQTRANLWGTATPNAPVKITTSWDKQTVSIRPRACFSPSYNKVKSQTKHVWLLTLL